MEKLKERLRLREEQKKASKKESRKRKKGDKGKEGKEKKAKVAHVEEKKGEAEYKKSAVYQSLFLSKDQDHTFSGTTFCSTNQKGAFGF